MPTRLATVSTGSTPTTGGTSLTFSHTVDSGTDVLLVSVCLGGSTPVVSGVTFDGVALTQKADASAGDGQKRVDWWYLLSPTVTTANVVVSFNFARGGAVAVNYDDVDVAGTPFGTGAAAGSPSARSRIAAPAARGPSGRGPNGRPSWNPARRTRITRPMEAGANRWK